ncbi:MAG: hypothetical protein IIZ07_06500 [Ruminococcus sp.]|nr:hypothetical protein [Ruminococcus sp.]MEE1173522.1 hypothetical protein [Ruminococcus sp.]
MSGLRKYLNYNMMKHSKKRFPNKNMERAGKILDDMLMYSTTSATDCTGLIPSAPEDSAQADAYDEIFPFG